ncbi:MAG: DUF302 domain-containing protein [Pseudomonadota bacterium]|nr:DUF302 domain-containing protein [Pseudomonadota bacterium]
MKTLTSLATLATLSLALWTPAHASHHGAAPTQDKPAARADLPPFVKERVSPFDLDTTLKTLETNARAAGWKVVGKREMHKTIAEQGGPKLAPVVLLELCSGKYSARILADDSARWSSVLMPCTLAVYEKQDGKTYVSSMDIRAMKAMLSGVVAEVMTGGVADDQDKMLGFLK